MRSNLRRPTFSRWLGWNIPGLLQEPDRVTPHPLPQQQDCFSASKQLFTSASSTILQWKAIIKTNITFNFTNTFGQVCFSEDGRLCLFILNILFNINLIAINYRCSRRRRRWTSLVIIIMVASSPVMWPHCPSQWQVSTPRTSSVQTSSRSSSLTRTPPHTKSGQSASHCRATDSSSLRRTLPAWSCSAINNPRSFCASVGLLTTSCLRCPPSSSPISKEAIPL